MPQTTNDIFPEKEKKAAKRKKIADMNAVTAQAILESILNQLDTKYEQYHFRKYCAMIIPIGNCGIEIRLSDSNIIKQRKAVQEKLAKLFDFISGGVSLEEVVTYCRCNSFTYLGYKARKYAVIDKTSQDHNDSSFESVFVPEGVASIGEDAFRDCTSLKSIQLPEGLQSIEKKAFLGCSSLKSIQLPDGVTSIGEYAFCGCKSLESIQLPAGVKSIGFRAFAGCYGVISIIVDSNNSVYDSRENCNAIIETATDTLIVGCQNTIIPKGVKSIGGYAFSHCESLKSIQLPKGVQSIGGYAFSNCTSLESIQLPEEITSIGEYAFEGCESLKSIQLPVGVTSIGKDAFICCKSLESIKLPEGVTSIGKDAFWGCSRLVSINVDSNNPVYDSRENCNAIIETATNTLIVGCQNTVIPAGVTSIGKYGFICCTSLESIKLPEGLQSIGEYAFEGCTSLENITFDGTRKQWGMIKKGLDWNDCVPAKVVHCSDGDVEIQ